MKRRSTRGLLKRVEFLWPESLLTAVDEYARRRSVDRTAAAIGLIQGSLEERNQGRLDDLWRASGGVAKVEVLLAQVEDLEALSRETARCIFGIEALLLDWVAKAGTLKVSWDELAVEVHRAGEDVLSQILDEAERGTRTDAQPQGGE